MVGVGVGHQILTKLCDFQAWFKILSPISNQALHSNLKIWWEQLSTQENAFGLCVTESLLLKWDLLKHTVYIQCILLLYISLFQIRKYGHIGCDNLF